MKISKLLVSIGFIVFCQQLAMCDGGTLDIISIKKDGKIFHFSIESRGILKNNDLCYYNSEDEYICEVKDVVRENLPDKNHYGFYYKELYRINLNNIPLEYKGNGVLHILKDTITFDSENILDSLDIVSAENENSYINTYSPDLEEKDNLWLEASPIEVLFSYSFEICDVNLFAVKSRFSESDKQKIKRKIEDLIRKNEWDLYNEEINKLYRKKIIMLGDCHC